jgi:hypothetical protein
MKRHNVAWVLRADGLFSLFVLAVAAYCRPSGPEGPERKVA